MIHELNVRTEMLHGDVYVIALEGEIDIDTAPILERAVARALEEMSKALVFDLTDVSFMDSSAVNVVLAARTRVAAFGGKVAVVCPDDPLGRVFEILAVRGLLRVSESREQAVMRLRD